MEHHGPTTWLLNLPLLPHDPQYLHINGAVLVFLFLTFFAVLANRLLKNRAEAFIVPKAKPNLVNIVDVVVESLYEMVKGTIPHHTERYFPFIATIFLFVFFCNMLGLLPLSAAPTSNVNTTFAIGLASFVYYNYMGIKANGIKKYLEHFLMGLGPFGIVLALLEVVSHAIRPLSLGIRLFVNMHVDHAVSSSFQALFEWLLPVPLLLFGVVVCTIQAFVFATLTAVYVEMATESDH